jgi:murein DD-endopeptidase MepM/ murein hydrolase activator NlpD
MQIILVSNRLNTAKTITITPRLLLRIVAGFIVLVFGLSSLFSYVTVRHAAEIRLPFLQDLVRDTTNEDSRRRSEFMRENLKVMAIKVGELQARLVRLDSLGERMANLVGIKPQEIKTADQVAPGRGGPLIRATPLSANELQQMLDTLAQEVEMRSDTLAMLDSRLFDERVRKSMLPTTLPVNAQWNASGFGWRIDPFTGERAMHEGVDFPADIGTRVVSAAAGIVVSAEFHPDYGNVIEIDHGNDLITRYAHTSRMLVKVGSVVKRSQVIAESGNSGRSTGPHLHFEVRFRGVAQNPNRFLEQARDNFTRVAQR